MLSLRRYAVYVGLVVCFLLTLNYFREPLVVKAGLKQGPAPRPATPIAETPDKPSIPRPGAHKPLKQPPEPAEPPHGPEIESKYSSGSGIRWDKIPVRYPVKSLASLPTAAPTKLPQVQHDFGKETPAETTKRKDRLNAVRDAFERCWQAYRKHAWMKDELAPLTGGSRDGFGGWAASLVDNLDNLWIMGFKSEFEDAVKAAMDLDLGTAAIETINVFETTIRHLGGFLSAYDLSGDKRCLEMAKRFGEMLLVAFDTPNHMPITRWKPQEALKGSQEADPTVLVAEIGSLTMEFTRLSQLTGDMRWFDAVDRIANLFDEQQDLTMLPGMWPVTVNGQDADFTQDSLFTLSAMSDSLYEYLPKMHALLGGADPKYKKMYDGSMTTAIKYNLFRPMTPENADILISGSVRKTSKNIPGDLDTQGQHLVCFAGGMFALGGKLFETSSHVDIGRKITDGCIYTYQALPLGIMPEVFRMVACESKSGCMFDEAMWKTAVLKENPAATDADEIIEAKALPKGFTELADKRYILRPEAIESVFLLYRMTGDPSLQDAAWAMFQSIMNVTKTRLANAAVSDITFTHADLAAGQAIQMDSMESFWYSFLLISESARVYADNPQDGGDAQVLLSDLQLSRRH